MAVASASVEANFEKPFLNIAILPTTRKQQMCKVCTFTGRGKTEAGRPVKGSANSLGGETVDAGLDGKRRTGLEGPPSFACLCRFRFPSKSARHIPRRWETPARRCGHRSCGKCRDYRPG